MSSAPKPSSEAISRLCCPSSGAGTLQVMSQSEKRNGSLGSLILPSSGWWSCSMTMPRASVCASASTSSMRATGAAGTPAASSAAQQALTPACAIVHSRTVARIVTPLALRPADE
jgi:hypothetical protein